MKNNLTEKEFWSGIQQNIKLPIIVDLKRTPAFIKIDKILKKYLPKDSNLKFLEIGCSPGRWLIYFNREFGYQATGVEYTEIGANLSKENIMASGITGEILNEDVFKTSLAKESFDTVFSYGFLEHFQNSENVIKTHWNLIKKGGYMILVVPNFKNSINYLIQRLIDKDNIEKHKLISAKDLKKYFHNSITNGKILFSGYAGIYYPWVINISKLRGMKYKIFDFFARYSQAAIRRLNIQKETKIFSPYVILIAKKN